MVFQPMGKNYCRRPEIKNVRSALFLSHELPVKYCNLPLSFESQYSRKDEIIYSKQQNHY